MLRVGSSAPAPRRNTFSGIGFGQHAVSAALADAELVGDLGLGLPCAAPQLPYADYAYALPAAKRQEEV
jgi:hypothetical protein